MVDLDQAAGASTGQSQDFRTDLPQVVIAIAVTRDGVPVRCWTFGGNTADTSIIRTVKDALTGWNCAGWCGSPTAGSPPRRTARI